MSKSPAKQCRFEVGTTIVWPGNLGSERGVLVHKAQHIDDDFLVRAAMPPATAVPAGSARAFYNF